MILKSLVAIGLVIVVLFTFPSYDPQNEATLFDQYQSIIAQDRNTSFPVMTFNIRVDIEERDVANHFKNRVFRIRDTILKWRPHLMGLQEPFAGQLLHLQSTLPKRYREIGFHRNTGDLGHPSRHYDFKVGFLYDDEHLELISQDYIWLSKTPRVQDSRSWNSNGIRTLNIAVFQRIHFPNDPKIIAFNTHLDAFVEEARREQSKIVAQMIEEYAEKYPDSPIFLFGDFNTAPGQMSHRILRSQIDDAWMVCQSSSTCIQNHVSPSFHGWFGSRMDTWGGRLIASAVFVLHGMGAIVPHHIPRSIHEVIDVLKTPLPFSIWEAIPNPFRLHVDWIMFRSGKAIDVSPQLMLVADVRDHNFSSDHFPIVGLFKMNPRDRTQSDGKQ
eukprot:TRINITY_DN5371_c0_g1_i1.p1 TRINITY_DN5371_c0_g1~~TRINITY_DN5371_c0_g1_i1.p1  ORF type:complete len:385 (+),score=75.61 TRINITY_DN5371_c0_g1_i1:44-1198(+)